MKITTAMIAASVALLAGCERPVNPYDPSTKALLRNAPLTYTCPDNTTVNVKTSIGQFGMTSWINGTDIACVDDKGVAVLFTYSSKSPRPDGIHYLSRNKVELTFAD